MNDVVALIPARKGSQRLSKKNYLDFGGISILENTVIMCIKSGIFDAIYLSTDDEELMSVALKHDIDFILRDKELADSNATSDRVVFDFVKRVSCNKVVWVNTASPLQTVDDIKNSVSHFLGSNSNSFVAVNSIRTHCSFKNNPLNFTYSESFAKTQDLVPVMKFVYSTMGWDAQYYKKLWESGYSGLFDDGCDFVEVSDLAGILLKTESDYNLINAIRCAQEM